MYEFIFCDAMTCNRSMQFSFFFLNKLFKYHNSKFKATIEDSADRQGYFIYLRPLQLMCHLKSRVAKQHAQASFQKAKAKSCSSNKQALSNDLVNVFSSISHL
jgi:hypothetical protein